MDICGGSLGCQMIWRSMLFSGPGFARLIVDNGTSPHAIPIGEKMCLDITSQD